MAETAKPGEFWGILAVVESVDAPNRKATVSDEQGIIHPLTWSAGYIDEKFAKLKPGYYRKFSGETGKPGVVTAVGYMGKDEPEWVKARYKALHPSGGGGGRPYQPRNEKPIIYQVCYKERMELARQGLMLSFDSNHQDIIKALDDAAAWALKGAKEDAKVLIQEAGCQ